MWITRVWAALAVAVALLSAPGARAFDFTVDKSVAGGTFTLTDSTAGYGVTELVVSGLGSTAGTTRPGWSATAFLFDDPLSCLDALGSTIESGFCYKLTDTAAGTPVLNGAETFTYDATYDDQTLPSDFAVLFTAPDGSVGACFGVTGSGCDAPLAPVPEPPAALLLAGAVLGFAGLVLRRRAAAALAGLAAAVALLAGGAAEARTARIVIDTTSSQTIGSTTYSLQVGRVFGTLDPADPHDALIQDIGLAPTDQNGLVHYVGTISILRPTTGANGVMLYQVSNRGGRSLPNASTVSPGATYVWTGWQGDLLAKPCITDYPCSDLNAGPYAGGSGAEVLQVPVAHNPGGGTITGPVYGSALNASGTTAQLVIYTSPVPYRPASLDTTQSTLYATVGQQVDGSGSMRTPIASNDWSWGDCRTTAFPGTPDPTRICLRQGFDPNVLYEMVFTARDPLVLGIGWAATRDAVSFLRDATSDDEGTPNPLSGVINKTIAMGTSQSGNYLRSFLYYGFNQNEAGKQVFDAVWPHIAGRQLYMNVRFALPDVIQMLYMIADEGPVWWGDYVDVARGRPADGLLHRCTATGTCPKIFDTYGALEFWDLKASPDHIGTSANGDIPLPPNVYRYYFPSTTHGGGGGGFATTAPNPPTNCSLPANPNPESDQFNALLDAIVAWVKDGVTPPTPAYPRQALGQLVPATQLATGFPNIPGFPFHEGLVIPFLDYDFGPLFDKAHQTGIVTQQPPTVLRSFPTFVVKVNSDGNEVAGVPSVNLQAPLGTYTGWNTWAVGARKGQICNLNGSFYPFAQTRAARLAAGDPRPSLEERYGTHAGFVCVVQLATRKALSQRFLRPTAAATLVMQAQSSMVLNGVAPTAADQARANFLCTAANAM
jgi:hypothetical protein